MLYTFQLQIEITSALNKYPLLYLFINHIFNQQELLLNLLQQMDLSKISNESQISSQGDIQSPNLQRIIDFLTVQSTKSSGLAKSQDQKLVGILNQLIEHEKQRCLFIKTNKSIYNSEQPLKKSKISDSQFKNSQHFYNKLSKQKNLNSPTTFYYLGELFKAVQNQQVAQKCFRKSIQIDENFIEGFHSLGLLLKNQKKYQQAEKFMLKVLELRPVSKSGHYNLGLVYQKMKKYELSYQYFAKTIEMDPKLIDAYQGIGLTLYQAKKYSEAKNYLEKGLAIDPKSEMCQSLLRDIEKILNKMKEKQHRQQKGSAKNIKNQQSQAQKIQKNEKETPKDDPITDLLIQQIYLKFLSQQKQNSNEYDQIMLFGELCQMEGNFSQAEKKYRKAVEIKPDQAGPYVNLSRVLIKQEKYTQIQKPLQRAVQLNPQLQGALNMLSLIYLTQNKKLDEAQKLITRLLTIKPNFIQYESMLAQCYIKNKKYNEAKSLLEKIEKFQPNNIQILLCLVEVYEWEKKQNQAYTTVRKAYQIDPKDLKVFNKLYGLQFSKKDFIKCQKLLRDVIQVYPNQPTHYYNLGLCLGRQQKYELAYNYSGKALQMSPGHPLYLVKHSQILFKLNRLKDALLSLGKAKITLSSNKPNVLMAQYHLTVGNLVYMIDTLSLVQQIEELLKKEQKMNSQQKKRFSTLTKSYFQSIISTGETQKKYDLKQKQLSAIRSSFITMSSEIIDESEQKSSETQKKYDLKQKQLSNIRPSLSSNSSSMQNQIADFGKQKKQEKGPLKVEEKQIKMTKPKQIPLKITSATLNENKATLGKMDPYCKITYGSQINSTNVAKNGHLNPFWEKQFKLKRQNKPTEIIFQVFEKSVIRADKLLGEAKIIDEENNLRNAKFLDLHADGKKIGWITLAFYGQ